MREIFTVAQFMYCCVVRIVCERFSQLLNFHFSPAGKHDATMAPKLNRGLVIKHNANQRYATTAVSASLLREIARKVSFHL